MSTAAPRKASHAAGSRKTATGRAASGKTPSRTAASKTATSETAASKTAAGKTAPRKSVANTAGKTGARKTGARKTTAKTATAKKATAKKTATPVTKDPKGGLTAAGRAEFARTQGSHLKPGVQKPESEMTPEEMKRKGSWAVRFYGRSGDLPPLQDAKGEPTRFALTAAAWGEPVPKTEAAARRIAEKGRKLLARYQRGKDGA